MILNCIPDDSHLLYTGWLPDKAVKLLGVARLRQHRVREHCDIHQAPASLLDCTKWFKDSQRDTQRYDPQWQSYTVLPYRQLFPRLSEPWIYQTAFESQTLPVFGQIDLYTGGGYIINLGRTLANSLSVLRYVRRSSWINRRTTVVFIEFAIYGVDSNLFNVVTITAERTPIGNYQLTTNIQTVRLLLVVENVSGAELVLFFLYIMLTVIFIIRVVFKVFRRKLGSFFSNIWNIVDSMIVALSIGMLVLFFERDRYVQRLLSTLDVSRNNEFVSFFYAAFFDQILTWWSSILITAATIRIWKIFQFIFVFRVISNTFAKAAYSLFCSTLITAVFVVVIAFIVYIINGPYTQTFSSLIRTVTSLAVLSFGFVDDNINSRDMMHGGKCLGIVLHLMLMVVVNIYLLNMFITVVCYYFSVVREQWQDELVPFTYWQYIRDEFRGCWSCSCFAGRKTSQVKIFGVKEVTCLDKATARMELIDLQLSVVSETLKRFEMKKQNMH